MNNTNGRVLLFLANKSVSKPAGRFYTHTLSQGSPSVSFCVLQLKSFKWDDRHHVAPAHYSLGTWTQPLALPGHVTIAAGWLKKLWHSTSTYVTGHAALPNHCVNGCYGPRPSRNAQSLFFSFDTFCFFTPKWQLSQQHGAPTQTLSLHTGGEMLIIKYTLLWPRQVKRQYVTQGLDYVQPHGWCLLLLAQAWKMEGPRGVPSYTMNIFSLFRLQAWDVTDWRD